MPARTQPPLSPVDRRRQVVAILAAGLIRFRAAARRATSISPPESDPPGLEVAARLPLSVRFVPAGEDAGADRSRP